MLYLDGFSDVLVGDDAKEFLSDDFQKQLRKKAEEIVKKENVEEKGNDQEAAQTKELNELLDTGEMTTTPDATIDEDAQSALDDNTNIKAVSREPRRKFGTLGIH